MESSLTPRPGHLLLQVDLDYKLYVTAEETEAQRSDMPAFPYESESVRKLHFNPQSLEPLSSSCSPPILPNLNPSPRGGS